MSLPNILTITPEAARRTRRVEVKELPDKYLACRDDGHVWTLFDFQRQGTSTYRAHFCKSCKSNRYQWLDRRGIVISQSVDYPTDYVIKGSGRLTRNDKGYVRLARMEREFAKADA